MWVYLSQLTLDNVKLSECHPAYQAADTMSTVLLVETLTVALTSADALIETERAPAMERARRVNERRDILGDVRCRKRLRLIGARTLKAEAD